MVGSQMQQANSTTAMMQQANLLNSQMAQQQQQMQYQGETYNNRFGGGGCSLISATTNSNDVYSQVVTASTTDKESLSKLYESDPILFNRLFIDSTISIGEVKIYTIFTFNNFSTILQSKTFNQYALTKDVEIRQAFNKILDSYFKAICKFAGVQYMPIKQKILTLLGIQIEIPTIQPMSAIQAKVSVSTNYRPKEVKLYSAKMDIENIQRDMFCQSLANCTPTEVTYESYPNAVQLRGSILPNLIESMLVSMEVSKRNDTALGIQTQNYTKRDFDAVATSSSFI